MEWSAKLFSGRVRSRLERHFETLILFFYNAKIGYAMRTGKE